MDEFATESYVDKQVYRAVGFATTKYGDTPTDVQQLTPKGYVDTAFVNYSSSVLTLTNKRISPRVTVVNNPSSYTVNTDNCDDLSVTGLAQTLNTLSASGSPSNFDKLIVRVKTNGSVQGINYDPTKFIPYGVALPSVVAASGNLHLGFIYDVNPSVWGCVAAAQQ